MESTHANVCLAIVLAGYSWTFQSHFAQGRMGTDEEVAEVPRHVCRLVACNFYVISYVVDLIR